MIVLIKLEFQFRADEVLQGVFGQGHVERIRIHLAELVVFSGDVFVHAIEMELQHSQFGVLVDEEAYLVG